MKTALLSLVAVAGLASSAMADITASNGYFLQSRIWNDQPQSQMGVNGGPLGPSGASPASAQPGISGISLHENFAPLTSGGFANKHVAFFSTDNGATPYALAAGESFRVDFDLQISRDPLDGANTEAGIWFHPSGSPTDGSNDGGLWVISNRTVFCGGMSANFALLGEGNGSNPNFPPLYTPGGVAHVAFVYNAPGLLGPIASYQCIVTDVASGRTVTTPTTTWDFAGTGNNGLPVGSLVGFRFQNSRVPIVGNDMTTTYSNVQIIPAPGAAAVLGLAGVFGLRRRRA